VQAPALRRTAHAPGAHQVQQHREAEGSAESTGQDRQADRPVVDMQPGAVGGEAGIVVRHDREEQRFPQCVAHITVVDLVEAGEQCDECDAFDDECGGDDYGEHAFDFTELRSAEFVGGQHALRGLEMVVHGQCDQGGERHDAKATHLHGEDEHALAEGGPMRGGVDDGDSACGNGGYCGEERGGERGGFVFRRGNGRHQQRSGQRRERQKVEDGQTAWMVDESAREAALAWLAVFRHGLLESISREPPCVAM